jgi:peptidoglycan/LPS O-acetylase OafA/YrhL
MIKGKIVMGVGLLLMALGVYIQTFLSPHWFIIGTIIALFGCLIGGISLYLPKSNGGAGIKLKIINVLGWVIFIPWCISVFFFKEELYIITTGLGGLICLVMGTALILYKGKKGLDKN